MDFNITCNSSILGGDNFNGSYPCSNGTVVPTNASSLVGGGSAPLEIKGATKYLCYFFYSLVFLFGVGGNMVVFYVIGYRKKKRAGSDVYILSLALADLLASAFIPVVMMNDLISDFSKWYYGKAMCYVFPVISPTTMVASAWSLVLISLDRYRVILKPMAPKPSVVTLYCSVIFVWVVSICINIPYLLRIEFVNNLCWDSSNHYIKPKEFIIYAGLWVFFIWGIPNIIMIVVYCLTGAALKRNTLKHANNKAMEQRNKQNSNIVKMFAIIVIIFFLLTMPYALFYFAGNYIIWYDPVPDVKLLYTLNYVLFILASANGCINPLIYAKMHRDVNGFLRSVATRLSGCCCSTSSQARSEMYKPSSNLSVSTTRTDQSTM